MHDKPAAKMLQAMVLVAALASGASGQVITAAGHLAEQEAAAQQAEYDAQQAEAAEAQRQSDRTWYEWLCECVLGWPVGTGFGAPGP